MNPSIQWRDGLTHLFILSTHLTGWHALRSSLLSIDHSYQHLIQWGKRLELILPLVLEAKQCSVCEQEPVASPIGHPRLYIILSLGFLNKENSETLMNVMTSELGEVEIRKDYKNKALQTSTKSQTIRYTS